VIADIIRLPSAAWPRVGPALRRWYGGMGSLFEAERDRWLIRY
jgi:hypothetical protein